MVVMALFFLEPQSKKPTQGGFRKTNGNGKRADDSGSVYRYAGSISSRFVRIN
jgi:hypothetical protein